MDAKSVEESELINQGLSSGQVMLIKEEKVMDLTKLQLGRFT